MPCLASPSFERVVIVHRVEKMAGSSEGKECKTTALWFSVVRQELYSSGDDGLIKVWRPTSWGSSGREQPIKVLDLNQWVDPKWHPTSAECNLQGPPIKLDALGAAPSDSLSKTAFGSPAAAHSLFGDAQAEPSRVAPGVNSWRVAGWLARTTDQAFFKHEVAPDVCAFAVLPGRLGV